VSSESGRAETTTSTSPSADAGTAERAGGERRRTDASRAVRASDASESASDGDTASGSTGGVSVDQEPEPEGFGRAGWVLVAAVVVSTLLIPGVIYLFPAVPTGLGFTFFATYLALPMVPAVLLGLVAVWSMTAATRRE
jgi:hypothetical protein